MYLRLRHEKTIVFLPYTPKDSLTSIIEKLCQFIGKDPKQDPVNIKLLLLLDNGKYKDIDDSNLSSILSNMKDNYTNTSSSNTLCYVFRKSKLKKYSFFFSILYYSILFIYSFYSPYSFPPF